MSDEITTEIAVDEIATFEKVPAKKPPYFVAGSTFYVHTDTLQMQVPLKLSVRDLRKLRDAPADADELDQLLMLLEIIGDTESLDTLLDADAFDAIEASGKFFAAWEQRSRGRLGK